MFGKYLIAVAAFMNVVQVDAGSKHLKGKGAHDGHAFQYRKFADLKSEKSRTDFLINKAKKQVKTPVADSQELVDVKDFIGGAFNTCANGLNVKQLVTVAVVVSMVAQAAAHNYNNVEPGSIEYLRLVCSSDKNMFSEACKAEAGYKSALWCGLLCLDYRHSFDSPECQPCLKQYTPCQIFTARNGGSSSVGGGLHCE